MRVPTSVLLFLVLTVLTCIVAYWADNLGKNLGKKRISLFGLRPRQTATLISMASSVAIMLLTLLALTYLNRDFKNAIFRSQRLNDNNEQLRGQNKRLERQREQSNAQLQQLENEVKQSQNARQTAGKAREKAQREAAEAAGKTRSAQGQLASTRGALTSAQTSLGAAKSALNTANSSLRAAQKNERGALRRERAAQSRFSEAQNRFNQAERNADAAEKQAKAAGQQKSEAQKFARQAREAARIARGNLGTARTELKSARSGLEAARAAAKAAQAANQVAVGINKKVLDENRQAIERRTKLEENIRGLEAQSDQLVGLVNAFAGGNFSVPVGQVFAERMVEPGESASELKSQLNALQDDALEALRKPPISATGAELSPLPAVVDGVPKNVDVETLQRILIEGLRESNVPVAVRWVAARNHADGEKQIFGRLVPVAVRVVAPAGTVLAQDTIAGGQSDAQVFSRLVALTDDAPNAARALGVRPPLSPQSPYFFAAGTNDRVFAALRDIQSRGGASRVRLVAATELTSVAPPQVRFLIEDAPEGETASSSGTAPRKADASTRASAENSVAALGR